MPLLKVELSLKELRVEGCNAKLGCKSTANLETNKSKTYIVARRPTIIASSGKETAS